jgi:hypothetical protein
MAQKIQCGSRIRFDADRYYADPRRYERVLCRARDTKEQILCCCVHPPRRLVVRQVRNQHWLAVWPNDREQHDPSCHVRRHGEGESLTSLSRTKDQPKLVDLGAQLSDVLPRLWDLAGLQGQRVGPGLAAVGEECSAEASPVWSRLRDRVMAAAACVSFRGQALSVQLHVSEARRRGAGPLDLDGRLILAPVHSVMATPYGWRVRLHHIDEPVFVPTSKSPHSDSLADWCSMLASAAGVRPNAVITMFEVRRTRGSNLSVDAGAVYACLSTGILTAWHGAGVLGEMLLAEGRRFGLAPVIDRRELKQPAKEDLLAGARLDLPTFVLTDTAQPVTGLFVLDRDLSQEERDETARGVLGWLATGGGAWVWDLDEHDAPPALPAQLPQLRSDSRSPGLPPLAIAYGARPSDRSDWIPERNDELMVAPEE